MTDLINRKVYDVIVRNQCFTSIPNKQYVSMLLSHLFAIVSDFIICRFEWVDLTLKVEILANDRRKLP